MNMQSIGSAGCVAANGAGPDKDVFMPGGCITLSCQPKRSQHELHLALKILLGCPLYLSLPQLISCFIPFPCSVRHAVSNDENPMPGLVRRLIKR